MSMQQVARSTLVILLILASAYVVLVSFRIIVVVLIAIILASAIRPVIVGLQKRKFPQWAAIVLVYGTIFLTIVGLFLLVLPPVIAQLVNYVQNDAQLSNRLIAAQNWLASVIRQNTGAEITLFEAEEIRTSVSIWVARLTRAAPTFLGEFGTYLGELILVVVMGLYWITSRDRAVGFIKDVFPSGYHTTVEEIFDEIERSLGAYIRGLVIVSVLVGIINWAALSLLRVPNAVTMSFIIAVATAIPVVGGLIGSVAATFFTLLVSPLHAVFVLLVSVAVQQFENNYLTPRFMSRSVDLDPILVTVVVFAGFALNGVVGALISVPIAGTIYILIKYLIIEPRKRKIAPEIVGGGILLTSRADDNAKPAGS